jgi:hypothetical protein
MPRGRDGLGAEGPLHVPAPGRPGSRPLLTPKGVLFSYSYYLDTAPIWEDRVKIFGEQRAKDLEMADKNVRGIPLAGIQLSKLLTQAGPYHRIVVANQPKVGYKTTPKTPIPAFAFVVEMRDADEFSKSMEKVLRSAALLATTQTGLKLVEEKYAGCDLVGYRFDEDKPLKQDVNDLRFNFSPCFVRVGNQFVIGSTIELGRELVDLLQKEAKGTAKGAAATSRMRIYSAGVAAGLESIEDQLVTQAILDQAVPAEKAQAEVKAFLKLLRELGTLNLEATFGAKDFHYDLRTKAGK